MVTSVPSVASKAPPTPSDGLSVRVGVCARALCVPLRHAGGGPAQAFRRSGRIPDARRGASLSLCVTLPPPLSSTPQQQRTSLGPPSCRGPTTGTSQPDSCSRVDARPRMCLLRACVPGVFRLCGVKAETARVRAEAEAAQTRAEVRARCGLPARACPCCLPSQSTHVIVTQCSCFCACVLLAWRAGASPACN
jgi:hypothetical protein